jgi:hypothetical protein
MAGTMRDLLAHVAYVHAVGARWAGEAMQI